MRVMEPGRLLLALSFAVLGALGIGFHDFVLAWQPVPKSVAWHDTLAAASGAILFVGAIGLTVPRTARMSALVLAVFLGAGLLLMQVPLVFAHPLVEGTWYSVSENLTLVAGAWTVFAMAPRANGARANPGHARAGRIAFALALPAIGLSHFFYLGQTAPLIPSWLPFHVPLAYLTGAAHIAAGIGILLRVRLAAILETVMAGLFTLLVWVPMVIASPASRDDCSELCISLAITGAAWAVAESMRGRR